MLDVADAGGVDLGKVVANCLEAAVGAATEANTRGVEVLKVLQVRLRG